MMSDLAIFYIITGTYLCNLVMIILIMVRSNISINTAGNDLDDYSLAMTMNTPPPRIYSIFI